MLLLLSTCLCILIVSCSGTSAGNCSDRHKTECCKNYRLVNNICIPCQDGWYGTNCSTMCPEGFFGPFCNEKCPADCNETCHHVHGLCDGGYTKLGDDVTVQDNSGARKWRSSNFSVFFRSPQTWIIVGCVIGSFALVCIVVAGISRCRGIKVKSSWKPTFSVYNDGNHSNVDGQLSSICCEPNTSKSSLRLPCKDCVINPTGKVIVSDIPVYSPVPEESTPAQTYSCITDEEDSYYTSPSLTRRFTSFKRNAGEKRRNRSPLDIDEKYMMIKTGGDVNTPEFCDPGHSADVPDESNAYFILEKTHPQNDDSALTNIENLPPPRFSVIGNGM
ncbi:multiple epidermal growth factor-like domains protein 11 isoform X2 [Ostrea edulis]|uniref:multiple epidermal growth factor-like domains protein 11 isoform X2 n=1 Tax=Ostrea edulis TaxID=37623 RepID=UPI0024AF40A5|nr:multiple epidermal growth factor-like domains protein 11 isoform X2 [Ostrea edulis]